MANAYHPERARAVITTKWSGGYKPVVIKSIESFQIDSNMDQDSDSFNLAVGDPRNHLSALLNRDGEIRIQIFGIGLDAEYLFTGYVDEVEQTEGGSITMSGRDRSAIAVDTMATAGKWKEQRADEFIKKRATALGITKFNLAGQPTAKVIRQDGSETEWEFWYRLIRKEQMWLWFTSDGTLVASKLAGDGVPPTYFFGTAPENISAVQQRQYIPVETVSFRKSTQSRVGEVELFYKGVDNKMHTTGPIKDPTIKEWEKRPLKYIEEMRQTTEKKAQRTVYEEIFDSKVGALEIKVTIPDLGFIVRSNRIARLRIPEIDLGGDWFVVGSTITASADGFMQEIRLREKGYAISKRVPDDPAVEAPPGGTSDGAAGEESDCLTLKDVACRPEWTQYYVNAARKYQSAVPYDLYLAILLAISDQEGCRNVRNAGNVEWFKWTGEPKNGIKTKAEWQNTFRNNQPIPGVTSGAVGPMQLYTYEYKTHADQMDGGKVDEFEGNRWNPEWNIMTSAWVLTERKGGGSLREENVWDAVRGYIGEGQAATDYVNSVRNKVYVSPGYLKKVQKALQACKDEEDEDGDVSAVPDENAVNAAKKLLDWHKKGWFYLDSDSKGDLEKTAAGQSFTGPCGNVITLNAQPLNYLLWILNNGFGTGVFSFATGHSCQSRSGNRSRHSDGYAADISDMTTSKFDYSNRPGVIGNGSAWTRGLMIEVMQATRDLSIADGKPKQVICAGNGNYDKVIQNLQVKDYADCSAPCYDAGTLSDHLDHIHVGW